MKKQVVSNEIVQWGIILQKPMQKNRQFGKNC